MAYLYVTTGNRRQLFVVRRICCCFSVHDFSFRAPWPCQAANGQAALKEKSWTEKHFKLVAVKTTVSYYLWIRPKWSVLSKKNDLFYRFFLYPQSQKCVTILCFSEDKFQSLAKSRQSHTLTTHQTRLLLQRPHTHTAAAAPTSDLSSSRSIMAFEGS